MPWVWLLMAGACEMIWPLGYKYTQGFKVHYWAIGCTFGVMIISLGLMALATRGPAAIHIGTAYAVWTGIGAAGTAILGILLFHEPRDVLRLSCISLIILGVIGLKFLSPPDAGAVTTPAVSTQEK